MTSDQAGQTKEGGRESPGLRSVRGAATAAHKSTSGENVAKNGKNNTLGSMQVGMIDAEGKVLQVGEDSTLRTNGCQPRPHFFE